MEENHRHSKILQGNMFEIANDDYLSQFLKIVNDALGFSDNNYEVPLCQVQVFIYMNKKNRLIGCVIAEPRTSAFTIKSYDLNSSQSDSSQSLSVGSDEKEKEKEKETDLDAVMHDGIGVTCRVGINKVWVHDGQRRKGIARQLIDCVRKHFVYGLKIDKEDVAFSQPTRFGRKFAAAYTGTHLFFVY